MVLRFRSLKTVRHYFFLGCYLGVVAAIVAVVRALPELPRALRESESMPWWDLPLSVLLLVLFVAAIVLLGGLVGGLVGWLKLNPEERARARKEALIVRR